MGWIIAGGYADVMMAIRKKETEKENGDYFVCVKELLSKRVYLINIGKCVSRPCGLGTLDNA